MRNAFAQLMLEVGQNDPKLIVLVGDISHGILKPFASACPGRFYNIGILEPTIVSMSAGISRSGLYPVAHTIAPFLIERSLEQIKLDFCYQNIGGNLISVGSAFDYSGLGCSHHSYSDLGIIKAIPNTEVFYPSSPNELKALFIQSYKNSKLSYFRLPGSIHNTEFNLSEIMVGKALKVRTGSDATLVVTGPHLKSALFAAEELKLSDIDLEILYYPTIKPFDAKSLYISVEKTRKLLVIEEHSQTGSLADDALRTIGGAFSYKFEWIGIPDEFQRGYGSYENHLEKLGFNSKNIVLKIKNFKNNTV